MTRTVVVGTSGSGKSTLARRLGAIHGCPVIELDALHWDPGWTEASEPVMRERVAARIGGESWVIDGNHLHLADLTWARATRVVWLDPPFWVVLAQILLRTARRVVTREELWNGNRETLAMALGRDSVILWAIQTFRRRREAFARRMAAGSPPFVRLRSRGEVEAFLAAEAQRSVTLAPATPLGS